MPRPGARRRRAWRPPARTATAPTRSAPSKDPDSPTYHLNLPATCGRCHGNAEIIRKGRIAIGDVVAQFQDSIHGQALARAA